LLIPYLRNSAPEVTEEVSPMSKTYTAESTGWTDIFLTKTAESAQSSMGVENKTGETFVTFVRKIKDLSAIASFFTNVERMAKFLVSLFKDIIDWISTILFKTPFFTSSKNLVEWNETIDQMIVDVYTQRERTQEEKKAYIEKYEKLVLIAKKLALINDSKLNTVIKALQVAQPHYHSYVTLFTTDSIRMEPLCCWFSGASGTGKSFVQRLPKAIFDYLITNYPEGIEDVAKSYKTSLTWNCKLANEYADGFDDQPFINLDDLYIAKDPATRFLESDAFMSMKNTAPYMMHMSESKDKGTKFCKARMICVSTNLPEDDADLGITDPTTVKRRRDFIIKPFHWKPKVPANADTLRAFETMGFDVWILDLSTLKHYKVSTLLGLDGFLTLVEKMGERYAHYHQVSLRKSVPFDLTAVFFKRSQKFTQTGEELSTVLNPESFKHIAARSARNMKEPPQPHTIKPPAKTWSIKNVLPIDKIKNILPKTKKEDEGTGVGEFGDIVHVEQTDSKIELSNSSGKSYQAESTGASLSMFKTTTQSGWQLTKNLAVATTNVIPKVAEAVMDPFRLFGTSAMQMAIPIITQDASDSPPQRIVYDTYPQWCAKQGIPFTRPTYRAVEVFDSDGNKMLCDEEQYFAMIKAMFPAANRTNYAWMSRVVDNMENVYGCFGTLGLLLRERPKEAAYEVDDPPNLALICQYMNEVQMTSMTSGWEKELERRYVPLDHWDSGIHTASIIPTFYYWFLIYREPMIVNRHYLVDKRWSHWKENADCPKKTVPGIVGAVVGTLGSVVLMVVAAYWMSWLFTMILVGLILLIAVLLGKLFGRSKRADKFRKDAESTSSDRYSKRLELANRVRSNKEKFIKAMSTEVSEDKEEQLDAESTIGDQASDHLTTILAQNTYFTKFNFVGGAVINGWMTGLGKRVYAFPWHFMRDRKLLDIEMLPTKTWKDRGLIIVPASQMAITIYKKRDLVLVKLPTTVHSENEIMEKHGRRNIEPDSVDGTTGASMVEIHTVKGEDLVVPQSVEGVVWDLGPSVVTFDQIKAKERNDPSLIYQATGTYLCTGMRSEAGDCGQAVISVVPAIKHKFLGIDVGASKDGTIVSAIYYEDWQAMLDVKMEAESMAVEFSEPVTGETFPIKFMRKCGSYEGMRQIYEIDKTFGWPGSTSIYATEVLKGVQYPIQIEPPYPQTTAPAMLREKNGIDPVSNSFRKMKGTRFWYDPDIASAESWAGIFNQSLATSRFSILSLTVAVKGRPELGNFHAIDLSTGVGFPFAGFGIKRTDLIKVNAPHANVVDKWNNIDKYPLKEDFPDRDEPGLWIHPDLQCMVHRRFYYANKQMIVPAVMLYCLKDETRPMDRVNLGYTRGFLMSSLDHLLFSRMVLGQFASDLERTTLGDSSLGINPYSAAWKILMLKHTKISRKTVFQDVDGWDIRFNGMTFCPQFVRRFIFFYNISQKFEIYCVVSITYSTLVPYVVIKTSIYVVMRMPSGTWATSLFNTIWNSVKNREIWRRKRPFEAEFDEMFALSVFGDDMMLSISDEIIAAWDGLTVARYAMEIFNHVHTDSAKSEKLLPYEDIGEGYYLQRQFKEENGLVLCPLNKDSLYSMVQWNAKSKDPTMTWQKLFTTVAHGALYEWVYHGEMEFEKNKIILNKFLARTGNQNQFSYTYQELYDVKVVAVITQ